MKMKKFKEITSFFLLVLLLAPLSIQLIHATEEHNYREIFSDGLHHIQHIEKNCAFYHHQINHNAIDLYFDFEIDLFPELHQDIQVILTETKQNYTKYSSSRAPPISFV